MDKAKLIASISSNLAEIDRALKLTKGVISGTPWVVELAPGLYLVNKNETYRGGSITGRVVCYSPERIEQVLEYIKSEHAGAFREPRKVHFNDALRQERDRTAELLDHINAIAA
jgi:hypothetical protein